MRRDKPYMRCTQSSKYVRTVRILITAIVILPKLAYAHPERDLDDNGANRRGAIFAPTYEVKDLGLLSGYAPATSTDLNNRGDATGLAIPDGDGSDHGVLFRRGRVIDVAPGAMASYASAINSGTKSPDISTMVKNGTVFSTSAGFSRALQCPTPKPPIRVPSMTSDKWPAPLPPRILAATFSCVNLTAVLRPGSLRHRPKRPGDQ